MAISYAQHRERPKKSRPPLDVREKACCENKFAASPLADVGSAKERLLSLAAVCGELQPL